MVLACAAGSIPFSLARAARADDKKVTYDDQIAAIFRQRCSTCHNSTKKKADLDVTNYSTLMQGGSSGAVIEAGDADSSQLFLLVTHQSEPYMPQNADKLTDSEIDLIRRWINGGALENSGSKVVRAKPKVNIASALPAGKRPDVVPMPPRMVLEPAFTMPRAPMARSLATSPWAPLVAVTSQRQVLLYNTNSFELVGIFPFPEGQPNVVRFSRDGRLLLAGGGEPAASGKVVVWDIATGERAFEVGNELDAVLAADISPDHKRIALGGPQRLVRVYSTETGKLQYEIAKHTDWVLGIKFSPDGVLLATADRNGGLSVWEVDTGHEYLTLNGHTAAVNAVAWRSDSNVLASASEDATVRLWEMENGKEVKKWNAKSPLLSMDFTRDGRIVTAGRDQITRIWNQSGKQLVQTTPIGELAVSVAYSNESHRAIAASLAGVVDVYKGDKAAMQGTLSTNPPTLDERLAIAKKMLQEKTAKSIPLVEAARKAENAAATAESCLTTAKQKLASLKADADGLAAQIKQVAASRSANDAERAKAAGSLQQIDAAKPSVAEALRNLTEALGKLPNDAKLATAQRGLADQLRTMEANSTALQAKIAELTTSITTADAKVKDLNTRLEADNKNSATATAAVNALKSASQKCASAVVAARKAATPAEAELFAAKHALARWEDEIAFRDKIAALQQDLAAARKVAAERQADLDKANAKLAAVAIDRQRGKSKTR